MPPAPPPSRIQSLRPLYLVVTMILTWFIGIQGMTSGLSTIAFLREGTLTDFSGIMPDGSAEPMQYLVTIYQAAQQVAVAEARHIMFPLGAAQLLLSGLLVIASGLAMAGRPGARSVTLQAIAANTLLVIAAYALTTGVRGASIDAVVQAAGSLQLGESEAPFRTPQFWWWVERTRFVILQIGTLALAAFAMTRPRAKVYFKALAEAVQSAEEP